MKKAIIISLAVMCAYAYFVFIRAPRQPAAFAQGMPTATAYASPTFIPTRTVVPTATVGYEQTVAVAQMTADEARRVNVEVTNAAENRILQYVQMTAEIDRQRQEVLSWTATAALTSIPLTATAQAVGSTQIAQANAIIAGALTATNAAPTQYAVMIQLQSQAQFARANEIIKIVAMGALVLFLLAGVAFFVRFPVQPKVQVATDAPSETVVHMRHDTGGGTFSQVRAVVPCTPEQLTELAENITQGKKTLAINQWEGHGTAFTRPVIHQVRGWMHENGFAVSTSDNQLAPTNDGLAFLCGWLESHQLPTEYQFGEAIS